MSMGKENEFDLLSGPDDGAGAPPLTDPDDQEGFACPICGTIIDHVDRYGKSWNLSCPACKGSIKKALVPENFPQNFVESKNRSKKKGEEASASPVMQQPRSQPPLANIQRLIQRQQPVQQQPPTMTQGPQNQQQYQGEEPPRGLFKKVKTPTDVLEEVCNLHNLNAEFITYVKRRSDNLPDGLPASEFMNMLNDLNSGMKSKKQAQYIVADYQDAMMEARMQQAQDQQTNMYPHMPRVDEFGRPMRMPNMPGQSQGRGGNLDPRDLAGRVQQAMGDQPNANPADIVRIIQDAMAEADRKQREEMLFEKVAKLEADLPLRIQELASAMVDELKGLQAPQQPANAVTMEQLMALFEKQKAESNNQLLLGQLEMQKQMTQMALDQLKGDKDRLARERDQAIEQANKIASQAPSGQLQKDESILLSQGLNQVAEVAKDRRPLEKIAEVMIKNNAAAQQNAGIKKIMPDADISDVLPDELKEGNH
jgi:hypothetical protein